MEIRKYFLDDEDPIEAEDSIKPADPEEEGISVLEGWRGPSLWAGLFLSSNPSSFWQCQETAASSYSS